MDPRDASHRFDPSGSADPPDGREAADAQDRGKQAGPSDPFEGAAQLLEERSRRRLPFEPAFEPLVATAPPPTTYAVDGSDAVLVDNGGVWVVAVRAAAVAWRPGGPPVLPVAPSVHGATPDEAAQQVGDAYTAVGLEPPRVRSAEAFAEALRDLAEMRVAARTLQEMDPDDVLLVDGALENLAPRAQGLADRLLDKARSRGTGLVGVAKRSRLHGAGVPLVQALQGTGPPGAWTSPVPDYRMAHVVRFHADAPHAFRVDALRPEDLPRLVPLARDAVYLGYPYPLAVAHNAVALTGGQVHDLRGRLADAVRRRGGADAHRILADFHEILDRNVPG